MVNFAANSTTVGRRPSRVGTIVPSDQPAFHIFIANSGFRIQATEFNNEISLQVRFQESSGCRSFEM